MASILQAYTVWVRPAHNGGGVGFLALAVDEGQAQELCEEHIREKGPARAQGWERLAFGTALLRDVDCADILDIPPTAMPQAFLGGDEASWVDDAEDFAKLIGARLNTWPESD